LALIPRDERHRLQIAAGTLGRNRGHEFEKSLASAITATKWDTIDLRPRPHSHMVIGNPAIEIIRYIARHLSIKKIDKVEAWWLGGLATSGLGDLIRAANGEPVKRSKTDVLISISSGSNKFVCGVSVKTCSKKTPTNDQLYFTTASAFCNLLRRYEIPVSEKAEEALKMFCGDPGFRPKDMIDIGGRLSDPDRWFFEELDPSRRKELEKVFSRHQRRIAEILLKLAYPEDPHPPEYLMHLTTKPDNVDICRLAIFSIDELVGLSLRCSGFSLREYKIRKGRFKNDPNIHLAPRFGFIQFQRGGQKQHPTQLQFNLQAGYFDKLPS